MIKNYYPCYVKIFYEQIRKKAKTPEEKYKKKINTGKSSRGNTMNNTKLLNYFQHHWQLKKCKINLFFFQKFAKTFYK